MRGHGETHPSRSSLLRSGRGMAVSLGTVSASSSGPVADKPWYPGSHWADISPPTCGVHVLSVRDEAARGPIELTGPRATCGGFCECGASTLCDASVTAASAIKPSHAGYWNSITFPVRNRLLGLTPLRSPNPALAVTAMAPKRKHSAAEKGQGAAEEARPPKLTPARRRGRGRASAATKRTPPRGRALALAVAAEAGPSTRGAPATRGHGRRGALPFSSIRCPHGGHPRNGGHARVHRGTAPPTLQLAPAFRLLHEGAGGPRALGPAVASGRLLERSLLGRGEVPPHTRPGSCF